MGLDASLEIVVDSIEAIVMPTPLGRRRARAMRNPTAKSRSVCTICGAAAEPDTCVTLRARQDIAAAGSRVPAATRTRLNPDEASIP
jgi:hypothetical protein